MIQLSCKNLGVKIGKAQLLQQISLAIRPGEFVGLLGPSGCGKSTLLGRMAGLHRPSSGQVLLNDIPLQSLAADVKRSIGFVPQDDIVHGPLTVESALNYSARLRQIPTTDIKTRVDELVETLELSERRKTRIDRLSGGQRKRVSIAVELLNDPNWLFLDEPTAGLDPALEENFMDTCKKLTQKSKAVVMSTHVIQSLDRLDLLIVLLKGVIQYVGPASQASTYFGVQHLHQIYKLLSNTQPLEGWGRFQQTAYFGDYIAKRLGA
jgi:ABC-type multidrug transport system ATPase subunit